MREEASLASRRVYFGHKALEIDGDFCLVVPGGA
jgi:hypothetical protein